MRRWTKRKPHNIVCALSQEEISFLTDGIDVSVWGDIYELGTFLGGSTTLLNSYLTVGEEHHCFDLFKIEYWMLPLIQGEMGESYRDVFDQHVQDCKSLHVHGDLTVPPETIRPIKLLFVDAFKQPWTMRKGIELYFSHVIPGGLIMDQDFFWKPEESGYRFLYYWWLRDYLKPEWRADNLLSFRVRDKIPQQHMPHGTVALLSEAFRWWRKQCQVVEL